MLGLWQLFMIGIVILWCIALVLLINLKVSSVNKLLWALIVTFVPLFGSIVFLVWRKRFLKQACESGQTKRYNFDTVRQVIEPENPSQFSFIRRLGIASICQVRSQQEFLYPPVAACDYKPHVRCSPHLSPSAGENLMPRNRKPWECKGRHNEVYNRVFP